MRLLESRLARQLMYRVILILVIIASSVILSEFYLIYRLQVENQRQSINQMMHTLQPILSQSLWNFDDDAVKSLAETMLINPHVSGVIISDDTLNVIAQLGEIDPLRNISFAEEGLQSQNSRIIYYSRIIYTGLRSKETLIGHVVLAITNEGIWAGLMPALKIQAGIGLLALTLTGFFYYRMLTNDISKPISKLSEGLANYRAGQIHLDDISITHDGLQNNELSDLLHQYHHLLERLREREKQIRAHNKNLETEVHQRTEELLITNNHLLESLEKLKLAQQELIEQERLASLGELVSGVAHEVNTPLGVAITANSFLWEEVQQVAGQLTQNELTRTQMDSFMTSAEESCQILSDNLKRAAELIESFKQVAVDQTHEELRTLQMNSYIRTLVRSLQPQMKRSHVTIKLDLDESLTVTTYPGAIAQLLTNLIMNAYIHAYNQGQTAGNIVVSCHQVNNLIQLQVRDFGTGMDATTKAKVYEPFFTTRRSQGGTGLGMNIAYNLVTQKLHGKIDVKTEPGKGTAFLITFPSQAEIHPSAESLKRH
ncbi:sensor histidine kinase [Gynuella sunshinyii]|uniref:histidine kinase n=1 Tax=Gynuella sunshinyii YC6258 TaxID=1445510 RepID=A0A0C5VT12_9GAMM|nr:HAMP domain-containing sensor histidine kinase [Gynuella sunshinyii]AJQ97326.1 signal transduction histidine kinase regulating C4-dicarboxylate transport system [Gynuella sunshinyii YC6258]